MMVLINFEDHPQKEIPLIKGIQIISKISFFIPALISYLVAYFFLFPRFIKNKWKLVLFSLITIVFSIFINALVIYLINFSNSIFKIEELNIIILMVLFVTSILSLLNLVMGLIIKGFVLWFKETKEKEELNKKNHQMELALVKSQLDPHFLFNTLNNIDVLILKDAEKASLFLNKLSDIMRFMLFETKDEKIELAKEITYIEKFIELQKIRTSNPNYLTVSIDIEDGAVLISPMLFIPFIENAFKYAEPFKSENGIEIVLKASSNKLDFYCDNKYSSSNSSFSNNGLGNELIQKRLALLYPEQHHLEMTESNGVFKVKLGIDL
jgi:LytS/YehU family sensor histidine kinase